MRDGRMNPGKLQPVFFASRGNKKRSDRTSLNRVHHRSDDAQQRQGANVPDDNRPARAWVGMLAGDKRRELCIKQAPHKKRAQGKPGAR